MAKRDRTVDLQNAMSDTRTTRQGLRRIPIFQAFNRVRASEWTSDMCSLFFLFISAFHVRNCS